MNSSPFDFINASKRGVTTTDGYSFFIVNRMLSSNRKLLPLMRVMNGLAFSRIDEETKARVTNSIIQGLPKNFYMSYPKTIKKDKISTDDLVMKVCKYYNTTPNSAKRHIELGTISDSDMKEILKIA